MASRAAAGRATPGQPDTSEMQARMLEDACRARIQDNMRQVWSAASVYRGRATVVSPKAGIAR